MYFIPVFYLSYLVLEVNTQSTAVTASKQMSSPEESTKQFHMFPLFQIHIKRTSWILLENFCPILPFYHSIWNPYLYGQPNQNLFSYSGLLWCLSSLPAGVLLRNASLSIDCMLSMRVFAEVPLTCSELALKGSLVGMQPWIGRKTLSWKESEGEAFWEMKLCYF